MASAAEYLFILFFLKHIQQFSDALTCTVTKQKNNKKNQIKVNK